MESSNLPPGVRESDIPGNRPEDLECEEFEEWSFEQFFQSDLTVDEARRAVLIGIAAVKAERVSVDDLVTERISEKCGSCTDGIGEH